MNNKKKKIFKTLLFLIISVSFIIITLSSLGNLYEKRGKIYKKFLTKHPDEKKAMEYGPSKKEIFWAKEILKGGYILHFRHAERDKWIDVTMYDSLESDVHSNGRDNSRFAENDYFKDAVCLNERGKIQAKAIGEHIKNLKLPISYVASSVSCRARQTADLAFDGYDTLSRLLVHSGPYNQTYDKRVKNLKEYYLSLPIYKNGNTIVSAHNGVIRGHMFENYDDIKDDGRLHLEEGGFYIISKKQNKLFFEFEFNNFAFFTAALYDR